jgi:DmsE family decaheme c-type cytochrome
MNPGGSSGGDEKRRFSSRSVPLVAAVVLVVGLFACVSRWAPLETTRYQRTDPVSGAGSEIGARECSACHDSFGGHFIASEAHADCESCHGPGQLHAYTAKAGDIGYPDSERCAACHQIGSKTLMSWTTSEHARSGILCSDCHDTHNRELRNVRKASEVQGAVLRHAGDVTRMCSSCHPEVAARFDLPSHHPMREGMMTCTDCHSPHGDRRKGLGAATQACGECHQEVMGPWIHEHPPVNEDCGFCHVPHGASADFLLEPSQPGVCISCHTVPISGAAHSPYAYTTGCTDCHNSIHGSYTDPALRR